MALPVSRNTTYAASTQVQSTDLNDIQDKVIDLNGRFDAEETNILGCKGGGVGSTSGADGSVVSGTAANVNIPIELPVGAEISSIDIAGLRTGANDPVYEFLETVNSGGATSAIGSVSGTSASREDLSIGSLTKVLLTGRSYSVQVVPGASSTATVFAISVFWKRDP